MGKLPQFIRYKGFTWHVQERGQGQVLLSIIGFQNRHTLTWGVKAVEAALASGEMEDDATPAK